MTSQAASSAPVLLLGARSDIAIRLAHAFAADGHPLYLAARDVSRLTDHKDDLEVRYDVPITLVELDVTDVEGACATVTRLDPLPHTAICCVGSLGEQSDQEENPDQARAVMETNFLGPAAIFEALAKVYSKLDAPTTLVGVSSIAGDRGRARNYYYGASKAAFTAMLSGLRQRLNGTQTRVITVKPGFVATRMTENMDLIPALTNSPDECAKMIKRAVDQGSLIVYPWKWRIIMWIIRAIPEPIFKRLKF